MNTLHYYGCGNCRHRLDVTLWGVWLVTGCKLGNVPCTGCPHRAAATLEIDPNLLEIQFEPGLLDLPG